MGNNNSNTSESKHEIKMIKNSNKPSERMSVGLCNNDNIIYLFGGELMCNYYNDLWMINGM